ncbi:MAG: 23S rRNA (uracil(1939)-C(5))-methyltransferase RlmD [Sulfurifustis sp.]
MNRQPEVRSRVDAPAGRVGAPRGDIAVALVESLTHDARGVARIDGKTTFIEGALPGERVRFRYHNKKSRYDTGAVLEVLEPSPDRTTPPCPHYGICGGCSLQHLGAPAQVRAKQRVLAETLVHVGRVEPARWLPPIEGSPQHYRRRARLGVRNVPKKGGVLVGFRERRRSYITPLENCLTLDARLAALLPGLRDLVSRLSRPDRLPQIEVSAGDNVCALVFRHLEALTPADIEHLRAFAEQSGVIAYLQPGALDTVHALWPPSPPTLAYHLPHFDVRLQFAPTDFIQVNGGVNRALVTRAVELLDPNRSESVLDLFCGLGNFTLPIARRAGRVAGIEADAGLIERARANAAMNGLGNAEFRVGNLYDADVASLFSDGRWDKLLLDPPRAGAMEAIKALPADAPARIVYVSCNPGTLARDSEYLVHVLGYRLEAAGIADMFPHTSHVESIALYVRS